MKKAKEMLGFYQDRLMVDVNEQVTRAEDMLLELLVGGVLKEITRDYLKLAYTYYQAKFAALKANTTTEDLKKALEEAKKEQIEDMSSTAKVEADLELESKREKTFLEETFAAEQESYQKDVEQLPWRLKMKRRNPMRVLQPLRTKKTQPLKIKSLGPH
uniref:Uncharacterized protein n=1 Tax=Cannabis sativa TaxID=3483 RepID=A0A803NKU2_CANSA